MLRQAMQNPGKATAHKVWLRSIGSGGFLGRWQGTWTVVHELAHAWDAVNGWQFSQNLERYTGGHTDENGIYHYGGTPPKGVDNNFTRKEDLAESLTTFLYPAEAQHFISPRFNRAKNPEFFYSNYYALPRAGFIANLLGQSLQISHRTR